jgi:hypothetical protein
MSYQSGQVNLGNASIATGISTTTSGQTIKTYTQNGTGSLQTVATVPAGKRWTLVGANWYTAIAIDGIVYKTDGSTIVNCAKVAQNTIGFQYFPMWVYAAGESVKATVTNGGTYSLILIEESA